MKVSVVTINYNNVLGLEKTILSVINQTYKDFEYIVIDGGSTDGSKDILEKYDDRINFWISEPDRGVYNAMNKGIINAKGKYIHFLNSGDVYISNNTLAEVVDNMDFTTPIIRGNYIADYGDRQEKKTNFGNKDITIYDLYRLTLQHQSIFLARILFDEYGLYNEDLKIVADWEHLLKAFLNNCASQYIDVDIAIYDMNGMSSNADNQKLLLSEREEVLNRLLPQCIKADYERFFELEDKINHSQHYYISNFVVAHKFPQFIFKILHKIYATLGL